MTRKAAGSLAEIRSTKLEIRNKRQTANGKEQDAKTPRPGTLGIQTTGRDAESSRFGLVVCCLLLVSDFEFRISDLPRGVMMH